MSKIPVDTCLKLLESVSAACKTAPPVPPVPADPPAAASPNWDAMANGLSALSAAISWGSLLIAVIAIATSVAWGYIIAKQAESQVQEQTAKELEKAKSLAEAAAKREATTQIEKWLTTEAPAIIRKHVDNLQNTSLGDDGDGEAADQMGEAAG